MRFLFVLSLAACVLAAFFVEAHPHFPVERFFAGYAIYGFAACAALILVAKALGVLLKRPDTYYDD